jgi:lactate dehydrogenase-like 2-hydroxyacid dehydrogenase
MQKPIILKAAELPDWTSAELAQLFDVLKLPDDKADAAAFLAEHGPSIRGIALRKTRVDEAFLSAVPNLEIISSYSAGLDNVDIPAVRKRNIAIETTSHILAEDVATTATGLALAVTRHIVGADRYVRSGAWLKGEPFPLGRSISSMTVGIVGLGSIGMAIARRLEAFGSRIAYFGPSRKPVAYRYYDDVAQLASDADMLILACPLSSATHHLVDAKILDALGPRGYVVNIARGPVIDERALVTALEENRIASAALDVFEEEPSVPDALIRDGRVVLTPHIGSATEETRQRMAENVVDKLALYFGLVGPRAS